MPERLISADSHVNVSHEQVKANLHPTWHEAYDAAVMRFYTEVMGMKAGQVNSAWVRDYDHPAWGREGHHDPVARLEDMDLDGIAAEVLYCEVSAFRYLYMLEEGWREATRAFNDTLEQFGAVDPDRLVVSYQVPIHDVDVAVEEVRRIAAAGGRSLQLPVFPPELGLPDYFHDRYDPLWAAVTETGLPMCFHIGLNTQLEDLTERDPTPQKGIMVPMTALSSAEALGMWMMTGVLDRFPDLKLVFVEPGLGWIAWYLQTVDDMATRQKYSFPTKELPSHYWYRNIHGTFIEETDAVAHLRYRLGVENIMWSTDYPHPVSSWPNSAGVVDQQMKGVPDEERALMVAGNAARVWNL